MNNREKCHAIIDNFSDEQLAHIAVILDSVKTLVAWDSDFSPNNDTIQAIKDVNKGMNLSESFDCVEDLMEELNA